MPARLSFWCKRWSCLLVMGIMLGLTAFPGGSQAACDYLSSGDFASGSGWVVDDATYWSIVNGQLDVDGLPASGTSSYAKIDFRPDGFFTADVEVEILAASDQHDRVGIRFRTSGDVLFGGRGDDGEYTANGVLCYYYPASKELLFKVYDPIAGEWQTPVAAYPYSGAVHSIGLNLVVDGVIFRVNGRDTGYKLPGDFSFAPMVIDNLYLFAGGSGLHARFDNVCAAPGEVGDFAPGNAMGLPFGMQVMTPAPAAAPVVSIDPATANPLGFGPAASGGSILNLTAGLSGMAAPVDLYIGVGIGSSLYLFDSSYGLHDLAAEGLVKWRANTTGGFSSEPVLPPGLNVSGIPGTYDFYFLVAPAGRLDTYYLWVTRLVIAGGGSTGGGGNTGGTVTDQAMETQIRRNIDLIFGAASGFSGGLDEITAIFSDQSVVKMTPADAKGNLNLMAVLQGSPLSIAVNFGAGHRLKSGVVMAGSAQVDVTNISFSQTGMGADFAAVFNNVTKDGAPFANGGVSGNLSLAEAPNDRANIAGRISFNNLDMAGKRLAGTINISGQIGELDLGALMGGDLAKMLENDGTIRLTFSNFVAGDYTVNSGTVDLSSNGSGRINIATNLNTTDGPVNINLVVTASASGAVINTTAPGTVGPYDAVTVDNLTMNQNACANYPVAGTVSMRSRQSGKTGVVTFTGACDGSYQYSER